MDYRRSSHYDDPLPRQRAMLTDRLLAFMALVIAAAAIFVSVLT